MRGRMLRVGRRIGGGLRRLLDNQLVFWLGAMWGVASVHIERSRFRWVPFSLIVGSIVVVTALWVVRWWMRRRWRVVLTGALGQRGEQQ